DLRRLDRGATVDEALVQVFSQTELVARLFDAEVVASLGKRLQHGFNIADIAFRLADREADLAHARFLRVRTDLAAVRLEQDRRRNLAMQPRLLDRVDRLAVQPPRATILLSGDRG